MKVKVCMKQLSQLLFICLLLIYQPSFSQVRAGNFLDYRDTQNEYFKTIGTDKGGYKQWKREEWYMMYRVGAKGELLQQDSLRYKAVRDVNQRFAASRPSGTESYSGSWTSIGPSSVVSGDKGIGRANSIAFHPTDNNILFLATASGGLWKTTNGGFNWISLTEGIPNQSLTSVCVNHNNPDILYILTGDADAATGNGNTNAGFSRFSTGVLKSVNGGVTWSVTGLQFPEVDKVRAYKMIMHPQNPDILFVIAGNQLFKTTNGGIGWSMVFETEFDGFLYDIEIKPGAPNTVYMSGERKFYQSTDGGQTFSNPFTLPSVPFDSEYKTSRTGIAVSPANPSRVYLIAGPTITVGSGSTFRGLYLSANSGNTFTLQSNSPSPFNNAPDGNRDQSYYDFSMAVSNTSADRVVMGGIRIYRSVNAGATISFVPENATDVIYHVDIHNLVFQPGTNRLYACTDGGLYFSDNEGVNWTDRNGNLQITQYYRFSNTGSGNIAIGGTQDNGTNRKTNTSTTFTQILGSDGMDCAIDPTNNNIMYATTQNGGLYKSVNGGLSMTNLLGSNSNFPWVSPLLLDPTNPNTIYFFRNAMAKSVNGGSSWSYSYYYSSPPSSDRVIIGASIGISAQNTQIVYLGLYVYDPDYSQLIFSTLYKSTDGGSTWNLSSLPNFSGLSALTAVETNPANSSEVWISFAGYNEGEKVFRSLNGGANWTNMSGSLPNVPVNCIAFEDISGAPGGAVYVGTDIGIFYRNNNMGDWIPFSNGLPVVEVMDLQVLKSVNKIRAATYGRGMYESAVYSNCPATITFTTFNQTLNIPYYHTAGGSIISTAHVTGAGALVSYKAGNFISLQPGFIGEANSGAAFSASIGPCTSGGVPLIYGKTAGSVTYNGLKGYLVK